MKDIILYHGSKSGLNGPISPLSRKYCDFGSGFYMGTQKRQSLTLICNIPKARLYTLKVDLGGLNILNIEVGIDWALLIALNRGKMEIIRGTPFYNKYKKMSDNKDMIIGHIANDRMFIVLDRFFSGDITDEALIHSLSALQLGKQYVAITNKACSQINILDEQFMNTNDRRILKSESERNRADGIAIAEEICRRYRRKGKYFDEIINGGVSYDESH